MSVFVKTYSPSSALALLRWLSIWVVVCSLLLSCTPLYSEYSSSYDSYFKKYSSRYLAEYDWRWLKAQGIQESRLDAEAVSKAGAVGVMQIMPRTWEDETKRLGITASRTNPKVNILVGASYMKRMVRFWKAPRTQMQRLELAQASYNAGAGNILAAQVLAGGDSEWRQVQSYLEDVTGKANSYETIRYVQKIRAHYEVLH